MIELKGDHRQRDISNSVGESDHPFDIADPRALLLKALYRLYEVGLCFSIVASPEACGGTLGKY